DEEPSAPSRRSASGEPSSLRTTPPWSTLLRLETRRGRPASLASAASYPRPLGHDLRPASTGIPRLVVVEPGDPDEGIRLTSLERRDQVRELQDVLDARLGIRAVPALVSEGAEDVPGLE